MSLENPAQKLNKSANQELPQAKEGDIILPEIAELEQPIKIIIEKIRGKIEKGEYGLIIGDDVSGRIPALILGGFIKKIAKAKNVRDPELIFIPGKLEDNANLGKQLQDYISKYGVGAGDNILLITESIESGATLNVLLKKLVKLGYECDVATMGIEHESDEYHQKRREYTLSGTHVISGEFHRSDNEVLYWVNRHTPHVFREKDMSGVEKYKGGPVSKVIRPTNTKTKEKINKSRTEAGILVDKLVKWYSSQDKAKS